MRVLIIAQYFPPDMGGGATRAFNIAKGLSLNGCEVTVIAAFPHYPYGDIPKRYRWRPLQLETFEGLRVIRTFVPPLASKGLVKRLILFISFIVSSLFALPLVRKVDVVWAANPNILSFFPAMVYGLLKRSPVVINVDDLWPEELLNSNIAKKGSLIFKIGEFLARIAYHKAKFITPISPGYTTIIVGKYRVDPDKINIVRAGVDTETFKPIDNKQPRDNKFKVLYSGAFSLSLIHI